MGKSKYDLITQIALVLLGYTVRRVGKEKQSTKNTKKQGKILSIFFIRALRGDIFCFSLRPLR